MLLRESCRLALGGEVDSPAAAAESARRMVEEIPILVPPSALHPRWKLFLGEHLVGLLAARRVQGHGREADVLLDHAKALIFESRPDDREGAIQRYRLISEIETQAAKRSWRDRDPERPLAALHAAIQAAASAAGLAPDDAALATLHADRLRRLASFLLDQKRVVEAEAVHLRREPLCAGEPMKLKKLADEFRLLIQDVDAAIAEGATVELRQCRQRCLGHVQRLSP
jgi:hypothetical protein